MEVFGATDSCDKPVYRPARRIMPDGSSNIVNYALQEESQLQVFIDGIPTLQMCCAANNLVELVIGRLYTGGMISSLDEVESISVRENDLRADVRLKNRTPDLSRDFVSSIPSCSSNDNALNDYFSTDETPKKLVPIPWEPAWIFKIAAEFERDNTSHALTHSVHSAYLATPEKTLVVREDIGRHNAFDKVIGWALINDTDLTQCLLFSSGRIPVDMVTKAIRARIPILVTKAVATDKTVELARAYDLTLICRATPAFIDVMNDPAHAVPKNPCIN